MVSHPPLPLGAPPCHFLLLGRFWTDFGLPSFFALPVKPKTMLSTLHRNGLPAFHLGSDFSCSAFAGPKVCGSHQGVSTAYCVSVSLDTLSGSCDSFFLFGWLFGAMPRGMWDLSSPTRDRTHTPGIGRQSLNHWPAREVLASACRGLHSTIVGHLHLEGLVEATYPPCGKITSHTLWNLISESLKVRTCTHVNLVHRSQVKNVRACCLSVVSDSL